MGIITDEPDTSKWKMTHHRYKHAAGSLDHSRGLRAFSLLLLPPLCQQHLILPTVASDMPNMTNPVIYYRENQIFSIQERRPHTTNFFYVVISELTLNSIFCCQSLCLFLLYSTCTSSKETQIAIFLTS